MNIHEKLMSIQSRLKAHKSQRNTFGNYNYRSCEDILEAVKPLLLEMKVTLKLNDEVVVLGDRFYVKSEAILTDAETGDKEATTAFARESITKKGQDDSQITGSTSSYARKYALNGLFAIDDTKDADTDEQTLKVALETEFKTQQGMIKGKDMTKESLEWYANSKSKLSVYAKAILDSK